MDITISSDYFLLSKVSWFCVQALSVDPIPRTIQQIVRKGVSLCDDWQDLIKYLSFYFKNKKNVDKNKKG